MHLKTYIISVMNIWIVIACAIMAIPTQILVVDMVVVLAQNRNK
jgi:hypothetical protein